MFGTKSELLKSDIQNCRLLQQAAYIGALHADYHADPLTTHLRLILQSDILELLFKIGWVFALKDCIKMLVVVMYSICKIDANK